MVTLQRFEIEDLIKQVESTLIVLKSDMYVKVYSGELSNSSVSDNLVIYKLENICYTLKRILKDDK